MKFDDSLSLGIEKAIQCNLIPMLLGEPGIGKSSYLEALAIRNHTKCFTLACNQLADKSDLTGARLVPYEKPDGTPDYKQMFYPHSTIVNAMNYAADHPREKPILFLDEINRTTADVTSALLSIPTTRSICERKLPDNLAIVIAGNDKGNIVALDKASISRFVPLHVEPDCQTFLGIHKDELNPHIQAVLTQHPECIFCTEVKNTAGTDDDGNDVVETIDEMFDDCEDMSQITTPRTIANLSKWLNSCTQNELLAFIGESHIINDEEISILEEYLIGFIGNTIFKTYLLAEITTNIMSTNNQSNTISVPKPACYDDLKACTSVTDINNYIENLNNSDKSGCLVYALYEREDNATIIPILAENIPDSLEQTDMRNLMQLSTTNMLDAENVQVLLSSNTRLAQSLNIVLDI